MKGGNSFKMVKEKLEQIKATYEKADLVIDSGFVGLVIDKDFFPNGKHKATIYFNTINIHIKLSDDDLTRFREHCLIDSLKKIK